MSEQNAPPAARSIPVKPDRTGHDFIKTKYKRLQMKLGDVEKDKVTLQRELEASQAKVEKLLAERDLVLDQLLGIAANDGDGFPLESSSGSDEDISLPVTSTMTLPIEPITTNNLPTQTRFPPAAASIDEHVNKRPRSDS